MKANERLDADQARETTEPVANATKEFKGYTYRIGFEHLAMENACLKYEIEQLRQAGTKGRATWMPTKLPFK